MTQLKNFFCGHAPSGTSHTNRHTGCWLVNAITAENLNQSQSNFVSVHFFSQLSLGLKMGFLATNFLVPATQFDKSGRLAGKQDNSEKKHIFQRIFRINFFFILFFYCLQKNEYACKKLNF